MGCSQSSEGNPFTAHQNSASVNEKALDAVAPLPEPRDSQVNSLSANPLAVSFAPSAAIVPMSRPLPRNRSDISLRSVGDTDSGDASPAASGDQHLQAPGLLRAGGFATPSANSSRRPSTQYTSMTDDKSTDSVFCEDSTTPGESLQLKIILPESMDADSAPMTEGRLLALTSPTNGLASMSRRDIRRISFGSFVHSSGDATPANTGTPSPGRGAGGGWCDYDEDDSIADGEEEELRRMEAEIAAADAELARLQAEDAALTDDDAEV